MASSDGLCDGSSVSIRQSLPLAMGIVLGSASVVGNVSVFLWCSSSVSLGCGWWLVGSVSLVGFGFMSDHLFYLGYLFGWICSVSLGVHGSMARWALVRLYCSCFIGFMSLCWWICLPLALVAIDCLTVWMSGSVRVDCPSLLYHAARLVFMPIDRLSLCLSVCPAQCDWFFIHTFATNNTLSYVQWHIIIRVGRGVCFTRASAHHRTLCNSGSNCTHSCIIWCAQLIITYVTDH